MRSWTRAVRSSNFRLSGAISPNSNRSSRSGARAKNVCGSGTKGGPRGAGRWEWDVENDALEWSKEHYTIMGLEPFGIAPKNYGAWADRVHPDDLQVTVRAIRSAIEERREYRCEYRIIWPDGSVRWVEGRGKPI